MNGDVYGLDVSNRQERIDWSQIDPAAGPTAPRFVWAKATEGVTYNDPFFPGNVAGAHWRGLAVGAYHFAQVTRSTPELQAQHFRAYAPALSLPAALDAEGPWLATRAANTDWCLRFLDSIGEQHRALYSNADGVLAHLDSNRLAAEGVDLWYARPGALTAPPLFEGVGAFAAAAVVQYGKRPVPGVTTGPVDADVMTVDTFHRYTGTPLPPNPEDEDMPPVVARLADNDELAVFPGGGDAPWLAAADDGPLVAVFVFRVFDPTPRAPWPNPVPRITDPAQIAAVRSWVAAGGVGDGPVHLIATGTLDLRQGA